MATLFLYDETINDFISASPGLLGREGGQDILWSDTRFVTACRELCSRYDVAMGRSFARVGRGRFAPFSAHYAGLAADFTLLNPGPMVAERQGEIRRWCIKSGLFSYVEPQYRTPLWIHAEVSVAPSCGMYAGYPLLHAGDSGVHVFLLQDLLNACGCRCLLCGRFGPDTLNALAKFRQKSGLPTYDMVDAQCWQALFYLTKNRPGNIPERNR